MISLQPLRRFFLTLSLALLLATAMAFGFGSGDSSAATSFTQGVDQLYAQIAVVDQVKAITKNVEGKAQEAIGNMIGNPKTQAAGKEKQLEAKALEGMDNDIVKEAKTLEGMDNSAVNPDSQTGGKIK